VARRGAQPSTISRYGRDATALVQPFLGSLTVEAATTPLLQAAVDRCARERSTAAAVTLVKHIRALTRRAVLLGLIPPDRPDPSAALESPARPRREIQPAEVEDVRTLRAALWADATGPGWPGGPRPIRAAVIFDLILGTGVRIGEACALRWGDVDLTSGRIEVRATVAEEGSGGHTRYYLRASRKAGDVWAVVAPPELVAVLRRWRPKDADPSDFVFPTRSGSGLGCIRPTDVRKAWRVTAHRHGVAEVSPHAIRRTVASAVAEEDGIEAAARQIGDTRSVAARHYARQSGGTADGGAVAGGLMRVTQPGG
jgi:integrase